MRLWGIGAIILKDENQRTQTVMCHSAVFPQITHRLVWDRIEVSAVSDIYLVGKVFIFVSSDVSVHPTCLCILRFHVLHFWSVVENLIGDR